MGVVLERGDEPVAARAAIRRRSRRGCGLPDALPHQPGAADLGHGGHDEQGDGAQDGHGGARYRAGFLRGVPRLGLTFMSTSTHGHRMSTTLQIAEVARRSGFTPATLRYYEDIGLLTPPGRTDGDTGSTTRRRWSACGIRAPSSSVAASTRSPTSRPSGRWPLCHGPGATADHRGGKGRRRPRADRSDDHPRRGAPARSESLDRPGGRACDESCACLTDDPASASTEASVPLVAKAGA